LYHGHIKKLSREAAREIDKADVLLVSPMVELELEYLYRRNVFKANATTILSDLRARIGLNLCELPFALVTHEALSLTWTEDPFDRMIVAQAMAGKGRLVTSDAKMLQHYKKCVW
jgi:PIN domain nuclease of toxin-antitoxin system